MRNYVERGMTLTLTALYAVAAGAGHLAGHLFGVAKEGAVQGAPVTVELVGVYDLAKHGGDTFAQGDLVYWDDANKVVTSTASGNHLIGATTAPAAGGDATARVRLSGIPVA